MEIPNPEKAANERIVITEDDMMRAILGFHEETGIGTDDIDKDFLRRMPKEALKELTILANIILNEIVLPCRATENALFLPTPGG